MVPKVTATSVADFMVHSFLAIPVAIAVGFLPEALLSGVYHNTFIEPFTPMISLTALSLALFSSRWIRSAAAKWVWTVPLLWFLYGVWEFTHSWSPAWDSSSSRWAYAFRELLTSRCGSSECVGELLYTTPLVASAVYSLTYVVILKRPGIRRFKWVDVSKTSTVP
jgi:hypothetical protein